MHPDFIDNPRGVVVPRVEPGSEAAPGVEMTGEQLGLRERKKQATRAAISTAAVRLCSEHGLPSVTVQRISAEAGVSVRTFFNYFSCKEEAVVAGDSAIADSVIAAFVSRPREEPVLAALRAAVVTVVDDEVRSRARRFADLRREPSLLTYQLSAFAIRERALADAVRNRAGTDGHDLYPTLLAACAMSALRVVVQRHRGEDLPSPPFDVLVDAVFAQLDAGLGSPLGTRPT